MKRWVQNVNRETAEALIGGPEQVCISITQPGGRARISSGFADVGRFEFADWDVDRYPDKPFGNGNPSMACVFTSEIAKAIVRFVQKWGDKASFLIHCDAGISRSAAVAEAILAAYPHYLDRGGRRMPNNYVKRLLTREFVDEGTRFERFKGIHP